MDEKYLADELMRAEEEAAYIRKRYNYFYDLSLKLKKENRILRAVVEHYGGTELPGLGDLAGAVLKKLDPPTKVD